MIRLRFRLRLSKKKKHMTDQSQIQPASIDEIVAKNAGRTLFISRKERERARNQEAWQGTQMAKRVVPDPVELTYDEAKRALWVQMKALLDKSNLEFYIHEKNKTLLNDLIRVLIDDMEGGMNPTKGAYLYGSNSRGKTWIMTQLMLLIRNAKNSYKYNNVPEMPFMISYKTNIMMRARKDKSIDFIGDIFKGKKLIFIDDFGYGLDSELVLYGQRENVIVHLIDILHREYLEGAKIFITSNWMLSSHLDSNVTILNTYGQGTHDRIVEMCTPAHWAGDINLRTDPIIHKK